jgi:hypothetical protein
LFSAINLYFFLFAPFAWQGMFEIPLAELIISNNFAFPFKIGLGQELEN